MIPQFLTVSMRVAALIGRFALLFLLARYLPPAEVGTYGLLSATASYALYFVGLDFYTYTTRELVATERQRWGGMLKGHAAVCLCAFLLVMPVLVAVFSHGLLPVQFMFVFLVLVIAEHFAQELHRVLVAASRPVSAAFVLFVRSGAWILAAIAIMVAKPHMRNLDFVVHAWLAGVVVACGTGAIIIARLGAGSWQEGIDWGWVRRGLRVAFPFLIATLSLRAILTADRYWLEAHSGKESLGPYVLFIGIAMTLFSFLEAAVYSFLYPRLVDAWHRKDDVQFRFLMRKLAVQTVFLVCAFSLVSLAMMPAVLQWLDRSQYIALGNLYPLILLATCFLSLAMVPHYGLYAQGLDRQIVRAHVLGLLSFLLLAFVLTHILATQAIPAAVCGGFMVVFLSSYLAYRRHTPPQFLASNPIPL